MEPNDSRSLTGCVSVRPTNTSAWRWVHSLSRLTSRPGARPRQVPRAEKGRAYVIVLFSQSRDESYGVINMLVPNKVDVSPSVCHSQWKRCGLGVSMSVKEAWACVCPVDLNEACERTPLCQWKEVWPLCGFCDEACPHTCLSQVFCQAHLSCISSSNFYSYLISSFLSSLCVSALIPLSHS